MKEKNRIKLFQRAASVVRSLASWSMRVQHLDGLVQFKDRGTPLYVLSFSLHFLLYVCVCVCERDRQRQREMYHLLIPIMATNQLESQNSI